MYKIVMFVNGIKVNMEKLESLVEACKRVEIYQKRNKEAKFIILNLENNDIEYQA